MGAGAGTRRIRQAERPQWQGRKLSRGQRQRKVRRVLKLDALGNIAVMGVSFVVAAVAASYLFTTDLGLLVNRPLAPSATTRPAADLEQASFPLCMQSNAATCIIDGDTFRYRGETIRIADIDTPEVFDFACASEQARGEAATTRLAQLMNAGPFTLGRYERDRDQYGRQLRIVLRDGRSVGLQPVGGGFARESDGARRGWC